MVARSALPVHSVGQAGNSLPAREKRNVWLLVFRKRWRTLTGDLPHGPHHSQRLWCHLPPGWDKYLAQKPPKQAGDGAANKGTQQPQGSDQGARCDDDNDDPGCQPQPAPLGVGRHESYCLGVGKPGLAADHVGAGQLVVPALPFLVKSDP